MWMLALNANNDVGEMRYVSMDGQTSQTNVSGLSSAHHDFTVLPGGVVAAMVWASTGIDPESNLIERTRDGAQKTVFKIGSNLYVGGPSPLGGASAVATTAIPSSIIHRMIVTRSVIATRTYTSRSLE